MRDSYHPYFHHHAAQEAAPMNNTVQAIRARTAATVADSLAVIRAANDFIARRRRLRNGEGKRNSAKDQQTIQSVHDALHANHDAMVALGATCDEPITDGADPTDSAAGADNLRASAARLNPPDPYAKATVRRAEIRDAQSPDVDPEYQMRGTAPDGYRIAMSLKTALASTPADAEPEPTVRHASGVPDSYATAIAREKAKAPNGN